MRPLQAYTILERIVGSKYAPECEVKQAIARNGEGEIINACSVRSPHVSQGCFHGNSFEEALGGLINHMHEMDIKCENLENPSI